MKPICKKYCKTVASIWGVCLVLSVPAYMLVLAPRSGQKKQLAEQLAEKQRIYEIARQAADEESKSKLKQQLEQLKNRLGDFVIESDDSANLTFDISEIAKRQNVNSFSIKGKDVRRESESLDCRHISESYLNINFLGEFGQFAGVLNALERHRPVVFVDEFIIARSKKTEGGGHEANVKLAFFARKEGQNSGGGDL